MQEKNKIKYSSLISLLNIKRSSYGSQCFYVFVEHPHSAGSSTETVNTSLGRIYLPKAVTRALLSLLLM